MGFSTAEDLAKFAKAHTRSRILWCALLAFFGFTMQLDLEQCWSMACQIFCRCLAQSVV